ncbi:hypothetical protein KIN34_06385 [Cellulomonas sp. DKR-3]|uniref:Lipoprotein n=1 Tax=Cellulomonas fulva TaxID=2835530 RepID=A0ABS5TXP7_9CELL|nr:hypothetical protein [Cellulomonas fulva]MBT0993913.1 hypothetical protein [Cellulomonas fulva]
MTAAPVVFFVIVSLTACAATGESAASVRPASQAVATATADTGKAEVAAPVAGDTIKTMDEQAAAEAAGLNVYPLSEGGIVYDPAQPLPAAITADITAPVTEAVASADGRLSESVSQTTLNRASAAANALGKTVIIVFSARASRSSDGPMEQLYGAYTSDQNRELGHASVSNSLDKTVAVVNEWVAKQADPSAYQVVVAR